MSGSSGTVGEAEKSDCNSEILSALSEGLEGPDGKPLVDRLITLRKIIGDIKNNHNTKKKILIQPSSGTANRIPFLRNKRAVQLNLTKAGPED